MKRYVFLLLLVAKKDANWKKPWSIRGNRFSITRGNWHSPRKHRRMLEITKHRRTEWEKGKWNVVKLVGFGQFRNKQPISCSSKLVRFLLGAFGSKLNNRASFALSPVVGCFLINFLFSSRTKSRFLRRSFVRLRSFHFPPRLFSSALDASTPPSNKVSFK